MKKLILIGAGGHAKVLIDMAEKTGLYSIQGLVSNQPTERGKTVLGYPVISEQEAFQYIQTACFFVAIGNNRRRHEIYTYYQSHGASFISLIHPAAMLGKDVIVGCNVAIMAGAVLNPSTKLEDSVIINTSASIDHDNIIGLGAHISPQVALAGTVQVGAYTHIGIGATVINNITIGNHVTIGAGAVVIQDIPDSVTAVGVPAKIIKYKDKDYGNEAGK